MKSFFLISIYWLVINVAAIPESLSLFPFQEPSIFPRAEYDRNRVAVLRRREQLPGSVSGSLKASPNSILPLVPVPDGQWFKDTKESKKLRPGEASIRASDKTIANLPHLHPNLLRRILPRAITRSPNKAGATARRTSTGPASMALARPQSKIQKGGNSYRSDQNPSRTGKVNAKDKANPRTRDSGMTSPPRTRDTRARSSGHVHMTSEPLTKAPRRDRNDGSGKPAIPPQPLGKSQQSLETAEASVSLAGPGIMHSGVIGGPAAVDTVPANRRGTARAVATTAVRAGGVTAGTGQSMGYARGREIMLRAQPTGNGHVVSETTRRGQTVRDQTAPGLGQNLFTGGGRGHKVTGRIYLHGEGSVEAKASVQPDVLTE